MPLHNLLEDALSTALDHISVARHYSVKIPAIDFLDALVVARSVASRQAPPDEAPLSERFTSRVTDVYEDSSQEAGIGVYTGHLAELLGLRKGTG